MMIALYAYELPVAVSMTQLARATENPIAKYVCLWSAFDNIYTTISDKKGHRPQFRVNKDGTPRTRLVGDVHVSEVIAPKEIEKLELAFDQFSVRLRRNLATHPSTAFFASRTPSWRGRRIPADAVGQPINGVISVGRTIDTAQPVWSPISKEAFDRLQKDPEDIEAVDLISNQILWVLYTVRNNCVHGGKRADDANDNEVAEHAARLLQLVIEAFTQCERSGR